MSINTLVPAFTDKKSSIQKVEQFTPTPSVPDKEQLLNGITDCVHPLTLLGMACKLIGELTDDRTFYEEAKRRVRCRGMAENHLPSKIERWEQLQKDIIATLGNYHLETDSTFKRLHHLILDAQCRQQESLGKDLEAQGFHWTPENGWKKAPAAKKRSVFAETVKIFDFSDTP